MRVCHATTAHARGDARIQLKECAALAAAHHDVHLVLGDGQGDAVVGGVSIHDLGRRPSSRAERMWAQVRRAEAAVRALAPDVLHFHDPELLPVGVRLSKRGVRVVYDVHEDVPAQIRSKPWIPAGLRGAVSRAFDAYERRAVQRFAGVVAATPHIAGRFAALGDRVVCVNNYPLPDEMAPPARTDGRRRQVCYVGVMSRARGIALLVRAMPQAPDVRLVLCGAIQGDGLEAALRAEPGWAQVDYLGTVDRATVARVLAESCAGVVTFLPRPNHLDAQPTKLFEYMAAGVPVIASDFPLWRRIVAGSDAGICVDPQSEHAIAAAIRQLVDNPDAAARMGLAGRTAVETSYNWPAEAAKLVAFYARLG
ncbi:MAG: glycosyltransferase family 4 protein [Acidimicrobiia bacterium]|nr:glycosyltransferase family 4 protein [Acidimicrobiia bacterium]